MNGMARRFSALLDRYGGRLREWPDADLEAVRQFAARDPDARRELAAGQALERTLDALAAPAVTPALRQRLLDLPDLAGSATLPAPARRRVWRRSPGWRWRGVLAGAFAMGLMVGFSPVGEMLDGVFAPQPGIDIEIVQWTEEAMIRITE